MSTPTPPEHNREARWISADGTFDPAHEGTTAALRRWLDGMEQALLAGPPRAVRRHSGQSGVDSPGSF